MKKILSLFFAFLLALALISGLCPVHVNASGGSGGFDIVHTDEDCLKNGQIIDYLIAQTPHTFAVDIHEDFKDIYDADTCVWNVYKTAMMPGLVSGFAVNNYTGSSVTFTPEAGYQYDINASMKGGDSTGSVESAKDETIYVQQVKQDIHKKS